MFAIKCAVDQKEHLVGYRDIIDTTQTDHGTLMAVACPCGGSVGIVQGRQVSHFDASVSVAV